MAKLVYCGENTQILAEYHLKATISTIGRVAEQDVYLQGNSVSRKHAEIHCSDNSYYLIDLSSLNGTFVNGKRISKSEIMPGDEVTFGKLAFTFSLEAISRIDTSKSSSFLSRVVSSIQEATTQIDGVSAGGLYEFLAKKSEDTLKLQDDIALARDARNKKMEEAYRQLTILYKISQWLNLEVDPLPIFGRCLDLAIATLKVDRGVLYLYNETDDLLKMHCARLRVPDSDVDSKSIVESIARQVIESRESLVFSPGFSTENTGFLTDSETNITFMTCPMVSHDGKPKGVLYFENFNSGKSFSKLDLDFIETFASQMVMTIDRSALIQEVVDKKEMECEMQIARDIQQRLLPKQLPTSRFYQLAGSSSPARHVGGDYFDFFPDEEEAGKKLGLIVLDVSGKGIPAALVVSQVRSVLSIYSQMGFSCSETVEKLNNILLRDFDGSMYATLVFAHFDFSDMTLRYVNAGHESPFLFRRGAEEFSLLKSTGKPCGLFDDEKYEEATLKIEAGDRIVIYTDGLTDAERADGEKFGSDRFQDLLNSVQELSGEAAVNKAFSSLDEFTDKGGPQFDDMTLVMIDVTGYSS